MLEHGFENIVICIAIIIILTIFATFYRINTFYPKSDYDDFCEEMKIQEVIDSSERCEELEGKWEIYNDVGFVEK